MKTLLDSKEGVFSFFLGPKIALNDMQPGGQLPSGRKGWPGKAGISIRRGLLRTKAAGA